MKVISDDERKSEQRRYGVALAVSVATFALGSVVIAYDYSSWLNWVIGLSVIVVGGVVEARWQRSRNR